jgi:hypothetical protein
MQLELLISSLVGLAPKSNSKWNRGNSHFFLQTPAAEAPADRILRSGLIPASADGGAAHICYYK